MSVSDESKLDGVRSAYTDLVATIGQEPFGGKSVDPAQVIGLGICGFDSLDEAMNAFDGAESKAALQKYRSLGECKDVIVKLAIM
jgi:hypothetical protein